MAHTSTDTNTYIGVHVGAALSRAANKYKTLWEAILEAIQNAIDAGARKVNVNINQQTHTVYVHDDGEGASVEHMNAALLLVGNSLKPKSEGKLGQFGIGVIASFGKCERFIFTTTPIDGSNGTKKWTFECAKLKKLSNTGRIPCGDVTNDQWWRSELIIKNYTKDQLRSAINFDEFCTAIYDRYNTAMLRSPKTTVFVKLTTPDGKHHAAKLTPLNYTGRPLKVCTYDSDICGQTTIRMFIAKKPLGANKKRKGRVKLMDSTGYTIPLSDKALSHLLTKKDVNTLTSGYFEGEIVFSDKLRVDPSRRFFNEDEITLEATSHIELWLKDHGRKLISKMEDEESMTRYRNLGIGSLKIIRSLASSMGLKHVLKCPSWGHQGDAHTKNNAERNGKIAATSIDGTGKRTPKDKDKDKDKTKTPRKPREKKAHNPLAVGGGDKSRTQVKDTSTGLILDFVPSDKEALWTFDNVNGIIAISISHPVWVESDRLEGTTEGVRNLRLQHLQERIILHVLVALKLEQDKNDGGILVKPDAYAQEFVKYEHFLTIQADRIAKRGRFRQSGKHTFGGENK